MFAASLVATGTAGFVAGGATGAAAGLVVWTTVWLAWWRLKARTAQVLPGTTEQPPSSPSSPYADIEEVIDQLDDLSRERGWDLPKRLEIARMACENRTTTFDELERSYDLGLRPAIDTVGVDGSAREKNAES